MLRIAEDGYEIGALTLKPGACPLENGGAPVVTTILNGNLCQTILDKPVIAGET